MNMQTELISIIIFITCDSTANAVLSAKMFKNITVELPSADNINFPDNSIFFIETAPRGLNYREACSVASAARAHPHRHVNVLFTEPLHKKYLSSPPLTTLTKFENIHFYRINATNYSKGTPLEKVFKFKLPCSAFPLHHKSDLLRYLTLYKFGGIYSDLDVIMVKNLDTLPEIENWAGKETHDRAASALLSVSIETVAGQKFIDGIIGMLRKTFNPKSWSYNSNGVLDEVIKRSCNVRTASLPQSCNGFRLYDTKYFNPIPYSLSEKYFQFSGKKYRISKDTYAFHVFNRLTEGLKINELSIYAHLAKKFCPEFTRGPRVSFNRLLRDISYLKANLTDLESKYNDAQYTVNELRKELKNLHDTLPRIRKTRLIRTKLTEKTESEAHLEEVKENSTSTFLAEYPIVKKLH